MNDLRSAVIGCGRIGAFTPEPVRAELPPGWWPLNHVDAILATRGLKLIGLCDCDARAVRNAAARTEGAEIFTDHRELLAKLRPELVTVATRTDGRCAIIADAVAAGVKAVHAEKPLCRSLGEGRAAVAAMTSCNIRFTWGATRRHMPAYREARALVEEIGTPRQIHLNFGCAPLMWTHPHSVDIASFFAGDAEPVSVRAVFAQPAVPAGQVLDADPKIEFAHIVFRNGVTAVITSAEGSDVVVCSKDGDVAVRNDGAFIEVRRRQGGYFSEPERRVPQPAESGLQAALSSLRDAVSGASAEPVRFDAARVLALQGILFAIALSGSQNGREVLCSEVPDDFVVTGRTGNLFA